MKMPTIPTMTIYIENEQDLDQQILWLPASYDLFSDPMGSISNSIGMRLVRVQAGEFLMGVDEEEGSTRFALVET